MDFAADAVIDAIAPPTRTAPPRASAKSDVSFDRHLEAAQQDDPAPDKAQPAAESSDASASSEQPDGPQCASAEDQQAEAPAAQADPPTPQILVQLIASQPPANEPVSTTVDVVAPVEAAPVEEAPAAPPLPETPIDAAPAPAQAQADAPTPETAVKSAKEQGDKANTATEAKPTAAAPEATPEAAPGAAPQIVQPITAPATTAATAEASEAVANVSAAAAPTAQPTPQPTARHAKAASSQRDSAPEEPSAKSDAPAASTPTAPPRAQAKAATPNAAAKDPVFAAPTDAPQAAPPQTDGLQQTASPHAASHAERAAADQAAARIAPAAHQVAREIVRRFNGGNTSFELRLDPPELGRVDVRLDVSRDHRVTAVIAADNPQALTELARHARELEQMLQGAGLELSDSGLSFDLRQGREQANDADAAGAPASSAALNATEDAIPTSARPLGYERWRGVRVDMMV